MWAPQLAALRDPFRVIAPDLRGYGDSPVTPGTVPMAQLAADVGHLLDRKGIASAALVGLSMGGLVVMELAAAQPERWWAYGFIATTAQRVTDQERAARLDSARTMDEQGMRPVAGQMAARLFGPAPGEELTQTIMAMMLATNPAGAAAAVRGRAERPDYQPVLKALRAPALVCAGDHDSYSTAEITSELAGLPARSGRRRDGGRRAPAQPGAAGRLQYAPAALPHPRSPVAWPHVARGELRAVARDL